MKLCTHCTMTTPNVLMTVRQVATADRLSGFSRMGYHYVIRRSGVLDYGCSTSDVGLHDGNHSEVGTLSVLLVGGRDSTGEASPSSFSPETMATYKKLIDTLSQTEGFSEINLTPFGSLTK